MACRKKAPLGWHSERSEESLVSHRDQAPASDSSLRSE